MTEKLKILVVDDEEIQDIRTSDDVSLYMLPSGCR